MSPAEDDDPIGLDPEEPVERGPIGLEPEEPVGSTSNNSAALPAKRENTISERLKGGKFTVKSFAGKGGRYKVELQGAANVGRSGSSGVDLSLENLKPWKKIINDQLSARGMNSSAKFKIFEPKVDASRRLVAHFKTFKEAEQCHSGLKECGFPVANIDPKVMEHGNVSDQSPAKNR